MEAARLKCGVGCNQFSAIEKKEGKVYFAYQRRCYSGDRATCMIKRYFS